MNPKTPIKILLLDDNTIISSLISKSLNATKIHHEIVPARSLEDEKKTLSLEPNVIDLVICDELSLSDFDGLEILIYLYEKNLNLPLIYFPDDEGKRFSSVQYKKFSLVPKGNMPRLLVEISRLTLGAQDGT